MLDNQKKFKPDAQSIAKSILASNTLKQSHQSSNKIFRELKAIHRLLEKRFEAYQEYQKFQEDPTAFLGEPHFTDEKGRLVKASKALHPCPVVNHSLDKLVNLTLLLYSEEKERLLLSQIKKNPSDKKVVEDLRQISIHAEASMEKEALGLIFQSTNNNPNSYPNTVDALAKKVLSKNPQIDSNLSKLKALVVELPKLNQHKYPHRFQGMVFKYFDNYMHLVDSELSLLKGAPSRFKDFSIQNLKNKTFTFVGAGFPLTGIILHIRTGAKVHLVDYDKEAVENAIKFIKICEKCNIVARNALKVIHKNALDIDFFPMQSNIKNFNPLIQSNRISLKTDILDLASALPSRVTDEILRNNVHHSILIRKRNVQGMSQLLYERYDLGINSPYRLVAEVTTPQNALVRKNLKKVVDITHPNNVNSCELYQRKVVNLTLG